MGIWVQRFLLIVVLLILAACDAANIVSQWTANQLPQPKTATYRNARLNYELDYPADWYVDDYDPPAMLFSSMPDPDLPAMDGVPDDVTKIDIYPLVLDTSLSLADYITWEVQSWGCNTISLSDPVSYWLDHGGQAVEMTVSSDMGGVESITYVDLEGRYFVFATFGNLNPVQDIVRTMRSITPAMQTAGQDSLIEIQMPDQSNCFP